MLLLTMVKWMLGCAPGFKEYLSLYGIDVVEDDNSIVGLDTHRARFRRGRGGGGGGGGGSGMSAWLIGLIVALFLGYIAMTLISTFAPVIGNLTYGDEGIGATIFGIVQDWFLPLALIGLLVYVIFRFLGHRGR